jgi:hypothetical protein
LNLLLCAQNEFTDQVLKDAEVAYLANEAPKTAAGKPDYNGW